MSLLCFCGSVIPWPTLTSFLFFLWLLNLCLRWINLAPMWVSYHWMNAFLRCTFYNKWKCVLNYSLLTSVLVSDVIYQQLCLDLTACCNSTKWTCINNYVLDLTACCNSLNTWSCFFAASFFLARNNWSVHPCLLVKIWSLAGELIFPFIFQL